MGVFIMRLALIENGIVSNTIEADDLLDGFVPLADQAEVGIGWLFDGESFSNPRPTLPSPAPVDPVGKLKAFLAANPDVAALL